MVVSALECGRERKRGDGVTSLQFCSDAMRERAKVRGVHWSSDRPQVAKFRRAWIRVVICSVDERIARISSFPVAFRSSPQILSNSVTKSSMQRCPQNMGDRIVEGLHFPVQRLNLGGAQLYPPFEV